MRKRTIIVITLVIIAAIAIAAGLLFFTPEKAKSPTISEPASNISEDEPEITSGVAPAVIDVQPVIDTWGAQQSGDYSIVVYDLENRITIGSHQPDRSYFAASIYKLYVAYEGYLAAENGDYDLSEPYLNGMTREECLDAMLRSSDSPCAEKLWVELGKEATTEKLEAYGIKNTSMTSITTTAQDAATLLIRLHEQKELPEELTNKYLDSMKTQDDTYRRGLPSGMTNAVVYNKVGWNELKEWHDTAIVTLPNDRNYVITLFTENIGISNIRQLGALLEEALLVEADES